MDFVYKEDRIVLYNEAEEVIAEITFPAVSENEVEITHTFVDGSLRGQGIAGKITEAAADYIRQNSKKVKPVCSYAVGWFSKHPEYNDILSDR